MSPDSNSRKAAAKCLECGEISVVEIEPDGTIVPIGQSELCDCDGRSVRIFEDDVLDDPD
ncbi:hypothetical protein ACFQGT_12500 [Natrialbaceae archaeon GCM10025810]|uniref:hypothetical protein n=1 Tax=Halovalidus salilacus TaxID=3075124 RepID=UPI003616BC92